jgi:hypothetical protein
VTILDASPPGPARGDALRGVGRWFAFLAVLFGAAVTGAFAQGLQSGADVAFAASTEIDLAIARATDSTTAVARFLPDDGYQYFAANRNQPGSAERHMQWNDVTIIRSGKGMLRTGRVIDGQREVSPGEWRGEAIQDPINRQLGAGDLIVIPAGMAHQLTPIGTDPLVYVTVKVPADTEKVQ